ncbi:hypothetical protein KKB55_09235 [Myxococcota bacterium]|nr:hypothetical protein [Myxococcota bacterium]MBU1897918.1 hypothetical protein [Myxococcota bacterium]
MMLGLLIILSIPTYNQEPIKDYICPILEKLDVGLSLDEDEIEKVFNSNNQIIAKFLLNESKRIFSEKNYKLNNLVLDLCSSNIHPLNVALINFIDIYSIDESLSDKEMDDLWAMSGIYSYYACTIVLSNGQNGLCSFF